MPPLSVVSVVNLNIEDLYYKSKVDETASGEARQPGARYQSYLCLVSDQQLSEGHQLHHHLSVQIFKLQRSCSSSLSYFASKRDTYNSFRFFSWLFVHQKKLSPERGVARGLEGLQWLAPDKQEMDPSWWRFLRNPRVGLWIADIMFGHKSLWHWSGKQLKFLQLPSA